MDEEKIFVICAALVAISFASILFAYAWAVIQSAGC